MPEVEHDSCAGRERDRPHQVRGPELDKRAVYGQQSRPLPPALDDRSALLLYNLLEYMRANETGRPGVAAMLIAGLLAHASAPAHAELGGDRSSVETECVRVNATLRLQDHGDYSTYELVTPSGLRLQEHVDTKGLVFAVSWSGPFRPDLRRLMGTYYPEYLAAARGHPIARGRRHLESSSLVMTISGHQRASFGLIYLKRPLPPSFRRDHTD